MALPTCQRNGRHAFCAVTPRTDPGQADTVVGEITYNATLIVSPGSGQAIRATYRGTAYEGGYTNAYDAGGFSLRYSVID